MKEMELFYLYIEIRGCFYMKLIVLGLIIGSSVVAVSKYCLCQLLQIKVTGFSRIHYATAYIQGGIISFLLSNTKQTIIICIILILIISIIIAIDIIDSITMIIPNALLWILLLLVICYSIQRPTIMLIESVIGMLVVSMPMWLINRYVVEAFGGGDIKLMIVLGYFLGWQRVILTIVLATLLGGVYVGWLQYIKKASIKYIPFAPYLCKSALIALFFSERIINWYF